MIGKISRWLSNYSVGSSHSEWLGAVPLVGVYLGMSWTNHPTIGRIVD